MREIFRRRWPRRCANAWCRKRALESRPPDLEITNGQPTCSGRPAKLSALLRLFGPLGRARQKLRVLVFRTQQIKCFAYRRILLEDHLLVDAFFTKLVAQHSALDRLADVLFA